MLAAGAAAVVVSAGWYLALVALWPAPARPYIGGSQHNSIIELALGYNGFGRLTGDETGGLGNPNFDAGWGRLFGACDGSRHRLAAARGAGLPGRRAGHHGPRTPHRPGTLRADPVGRLADGHRGGVQLLHGIVHPYYTVALAPAIAACLGIGAPLLWRRRADPRAAAALSATVLVTSVLAAVLLARHGDWLPWLRAAIPVAGILAAVLLPVAGRLADPVRRATAVLALAACLAAPAAYTVATAATPHTGAIPSAGPARSGGPGGPGGPGGLLTAPAPDRAVVAALSADADSYTWVAAVVGSNNAAGYQLATGAPVMAVGGFNGTDPAPTVAQFKSIVADHEIHYFIRGRSMVGGWGHVHSGSRDAAEITEWVQTHYRPVRLGDLIVYDLSTAPVDS